MKSSKIRLIAMKLIIKVLSDLQVADLGEVVCSLILYKLSS